MTTCLSSPRGVLRSRSSIASRGAELGGLEPHRETRASASLSTRRPSRSSSCSATPSALVPSPSSESFLTVGLASITPRAELVQLCEGVDPWHRDESSRAEAPRSAFDAALFVGTFLAGKAEERVEAVMRAKSDEALVLGAVPSSDGLRLRRGEVVVPDHLGQSAECFGCADVTPRTGTVNSA